MAAQQKVSNEEVRGAIFLWRGNVEAAADKLGVTPKNLRKRLDRLGIDLEGVRSSASPIVRTGTDPVPSTPPDPMNPTGPVTGGGVYEFPVPAPRLVGMSAAASAKVDEAPIATVRSKQQPTRVRPDQQDRLRAAKFELMGKYKVDTDENAMLQQFIDERFDGWLAEKLEQGR